MKTFVISLPEAKERQDFMRNHLGTHGITFQFFDGVDGRGFDVPSHPAYNKIKRRLFFGRDLKGGEIGILLSHIRIYETMVRDNIPIAFILEDDTKIHDDLPKLLDILEKDHNDFELIRFLGKDKVLNGTQHTKRKLWKDYTLNRIMATPGGAYAYVITRKGAEKILRHTRKNYLPIDTIMGHCWVTGLEAFIAVPPLSFIEDDVPQYIGDARFDKANKVKDWTRFFYPFTRALYKLYEGLMKRLYYFYKKQQDKA